MSVQQYQLATARSTDYFGYFNLFERYFGDLAFSLIFAAMLSLIFESPFLVLEKLFATDSGVRNMKSEVNEGYEEESSGSDKDEKIFVA